MNDGSCSITRNVFCHRLPVWHGRSFIRPQVNTEPMTDTNPRDLIRRLTEKLDELNCNFNVPNQSALIAEARAALAQPEPQGPTDEARLADFAGWLAREMPANTIIGDPLWWAPRIARAVLARWGRPAIEPVPKREGEQ